MIIIEIPGLNLEISKTFFDSLNTNIENEVVFFDWQGLDNPIVDLAELISKSINTSGPVQIYAKSYGSYIGAEAIKLLNKQGTVNYEEQVTLVVFGLPYRLGYPPDPEILKNPSSSYDDNLLAKNFLNEITATGVGVKIFQGQNDDLGPSANLDEQASGIYNLKVELVPDQDHSLDPQTIFGLLYGQKE